MKGFGAQQRLGAVLILVLPVLTVAAGAWKADAIALMCGCLAAAGVTAAVAWSWLTDLVNLADFVAHLAGRREPVAPPLNTGIARRLSSALSRAHHDWMVESRRHSALAASYEATLDSIPDPLFLLDGARRVVGANVAANALVERDPLDMEIGALLRVPAVMDAVDRALAGQPTNDVEFSLSGPTERTFLARLRRLSEPGVGGTRVVLALHDITTIRRSERMRAEFVANASHELRTPLAGLQGYIETLAGPARNDAPARERFLPIMLQMAQRMGRLIEDLLSLSRIEFSEHARPTDPVDLGAVVRGVAETLAPQAEARSMTITTDIAPDLPAIPGQADQVAQVVQNLVDNALKYGRPGTPVEVSVGLADSAARPGGPYLAVIVRDHGEGIAREHLPRLTERFYRCDAARSRELGGTGLGLAIVKHIVNRHRAHLAIDSTEGKGSTFTVTFRTKGAS
jgi:two-component system phosphate regulon sensor histidine kinase PhoR